MDVTQHPHNIVIVKLQVNVIIDWRVTIPYEPTPIPLITYQPELPVAAHMATSRMFHPILLQIISIRPASDLHHSPQRVPEKVLTLHQSVNKETRIQVHVPIKLHH